MKTEIIEKNSGDTPEVAELKQKIFDAEEAQLRVGLSPTPEFEKLVAEKQAMGLSRSDAIVCARRNVLSAAVTIERDAVVAKALEKFEKEFNGDKRSPEYKQARAEAISKAVADGNFHEKFVAAGSHQLNPATN